MNGNIVKIFHRCTLEHCFSRSPLDVLSVESVEVPPVLSAHVGVDGGLIQLSETCDTLEDKAVIYLSTWIGLVGLELKQLSILV